jgi:hypothetical protein
MDDLSNPWKAAAASALAFVFGAGAAPPVFSLSCRRFRHTGASMYSM